MLVTISRTVTSITAFSVTKKPQKKPSWAEATLLWFTRPGLKSSNYIKSTPMASNCYRPVSRPKCNCHCTFFCLTYDWMIHLHTARNFFWLGIWLSLLLKINFCDMYIHWLHYCQIMVKCWSSKLHSFLPLNNLDIQLLHYGCCLNIWCFSKSQPCVRHYDIAVDWTCEEIEANDGEAHVACENMQSMCQGILMSYWLGIHIMMMVKVLKTTLDKIPFDYTAQIFFELKHQGGTAVTSLLGAQVLWSQITTHIYNYTTTYITFCPTIIEYWKSSD